MKKAVRWIGMVLGVLIGLFVVISLVGYVLGSRRLGKTYEVSGSPIAVSTDPEAIERGRHWTQVLCIECHGETLGGKVAFEDPTIAVVNGSNLTTGAGGASSEMSDEELEVAIRHGIDHDGRGLVMMPSAAYFYLADEDVAAIIAYLRHTPPVDKEWEEPEFTFIARVLVGLGLFGNVSAAEVIDHQAARPAVPPSAPTSEYGAYLARIGGCWECHGEQLNGGNSPDPSAPPAPNLTPGGHLGEWSEADFFTAMRTGVEPDGEEMDVKFMPWEGIGKMTDDELRALWLYLQSLPALEDAVEEPGEQGARVHEHVLSRVSESAHPVRQVFLVAGSLFLIGNSDIFGMPYWMLGSFLSAAGLVLLALGTLAARKFPRWAAWLWIASVVIGLPSVFVPA